CGSRPPSSSVSGQCSPRSPTTTAPSPPIPPEALMPDLLPTLDANRARWTPPWVNEMHPQFCAAPNGCDGHHTSRPVEVHTGGAGPWLLVAADMDRTGRCTVAVT